MRELWCAIICLTLGLGISMQSFSQVNTDSLWDVWNDESKADTTRLNALYNMAWYGFMYSKPDSAFTLGQIEADFAASKGDLEALGNALSLQGVSLYLRGKNEEAIKYLERSIEEKRKLHDELKLVSAVSNLGMVYKRMGNYEKALKHYMYGLRILEKHDKKTHLAISYNNLGNIYSDQGLIDSAVHYYSKSLKLHEEINDKRGLANTYANLAMLYEGQQMFEKSIEFYQKSIDLYKETGNTYDLGTTILNLAVLYSEIGNPEREYQYNMEGYKLCEKSGNKAGMAMALSNIGGYFMVKGEDDKALNYFNRSLEMKQTIGDEAGILSSLNMLGRFYYVTGRYRESLKYYQKALTLCKKVPYLQYVIRTHEGLYKLYKATGKSKASLEHYETYVSLRDSLEKEQNQKEVIRQQYKYEYDKQAAADSVKAAEAAKLKDAQLTAQKAENVKQKQQSYFLYGGLALALLFGGFIFNRFRVTNRQKAFIEEQKTEVEAQRELAEQQRSEAENQKLIVEAKNHEILDSIHYAKRLQEAILPPKKVVKEYLHESFILYKPKDIVAGDFYWLETPPHNSPSLEGEGDFIYFAAADCTGHGVPGAMVSVVCSNALTKALIEEKITDPGKILDRTRELVIDRFGKSDAEIKDGMDIALVKLAQSESESRERSLQYAGANNPLWIVRNEAVEVEEIKADKQPIGKYAAEKPFTTHTIHLNKGDSIYIFSDGYVDQFGGEKGKKYKSGQMKKLLLSMQDNDMATQRNILNDAFETWRGELEQIDDVCVIGVIV